MEKKLQLEKVKLELQEIASEVNYFESLRWDDRSLFQEVLQTYEDIKKRQEFLIKTELVLENRFLERFVFPERYP